MVQEEKKIKRSKVKYFSQSFNALFLFEGKREVKGSLVLLIMKRKNKKKKKPKKKRQKKQKMHRLCETEKMYLGVLYAY